MRRSIFILFVCMLLFTATHADAQSVKISIGTDSLTVGQLLAAIENQTDYLIIFRHRDVDMDRMVQIKGISDKISAYLDAAFRETDIEYEFHNNYILLSKMSLDNISSAIRRGKKVSGTITDEEGDPIDGVNIVIKGHKTGVISNSEGKFTLVVPEKATLLFSYVGFLPQEIPVGDKPGIHVVLREDSQLLEEVVVIGYGNQKKTNLSGAVESVSAKAFENRSIHNIGTALQGVVPNLNISPNGGQANAVPTFNIRGETSINGGSPLILVDGIPTSEADFIRMNVMDIEHISILKDASSAAIYGARASFGVILVTTKMGTGDKPTVRFNHNVNIRTLTNMPKVVKNPYIQASYKKEMGKPWYDLYTEEEVEYAQKRVADPSLPETIISSLNPNKYTYLASTDWFSEIFDKVGLSHQHNLSISGSTGKASYYLGTEYYGESGMLHYNKDHYNRFNVRSKVGYRLSDRLTVGNNTALTYYKYERPTNFDSYLFTQANETNTLVPVYNPYGSYTREGAQLVGALVDGGESTTKNATIYTQFTADADLIKNSWKVKADFTAKINDTRDDAWNSDRKIPYRTGPDAVDLYLGWENYAQKTDVRTMYTLFNLYTDFQKDFGSHNISAVGGYSQEYENYNYFMSKRNDLISDAYPTPQLATGDITVTEDDYTWVIRSGFYRLSYIYNHTYIIETNGRYDGTSRFPHTGRYKFFPSVSAAWIFTQERFFKPANSWFNHGKLRASYGSLGNQNVSYYSYIAAMSVGKMDYLLDGNKPMGVYKPGLVSNSLTWEKVYTQNGGLDLHFLSNRLIVSGDIYRRDTKDMLTKGKTLPNVLGTAEPKVNAADMKTCGWEISACWTDAFSLIYKPFNYSARFILSDSRSRITRFDNPTRYLSDYYEGQKLGEIWGLVTEGFFQDQADIDAHADQWQVTSYPGDRPIEPGDLKYKDLNNDGKITKGSNTVDDPGDFKVIGNSRARYLYGLDLNADWNGFDLRILFQGVGKRDWYPYPSEAWGQFAGIFWSPWGNVYTNNLDHWTPENPDGYFPRLKSYLAFHRQQGDMSLAQTRYLQNAAYLRLKNITFGYSIPKRLLRTFKMEKVRFYFSGENLFEATPLSKNFDPEQLNYTSHPLQRTYSIGLNVTL